MQHNKRRVSCCIRRLKYNVKAYD